MMIALLAVLLGVASADHVRQYFPMANTTSNDDNMLGICYGSSTTWAQYPYTAALRYSNGGACCSASIVSLNPGILVSAAHCNGCNGSPRIGCNNPANCDGDTYNIAQFVQNPDYGQGTQFSNDIAIVRLSTAITTSGASTIDIPSVEQTGGNVRATSYGITESGTIPTSLQTGTMPIVERTLCESIMSSALGGSGYVDISMICAAGNGGTGPATSTCSGDSGGPWTVGNSLYGVTSWGLQGSGGGCSCGCNCCCGYPGVAANVAQFTTWINGYMSEWTDKYYQS
jgi:hypothetical protein